VGSSTVALVQLTLTDNQLGDSDITVGRIVDPGGLAVVQAACDVRYLLTESNGVYQVSMQSNVTYTGLDNIIASMQVALRAPTGEIQVDESCILDTYGNTSFVVSTLNSPAETPAYDYITFNINEAFSSDITFTAGETVPLFTFKNGTDCSNGGVLELIGPEGVTPPNLAGNNIAPQLSTSGGGADQPVCVDATTAPINCTTNSGGNTGGNTGNSSNCDITYVLSESNGIYQVSIDSDVTYTGSDNIIASMQVSLRVPTGTFEVVNGSISDTYNNTDFLVSMVTSPSETPTYDYINFTIDGSISTEIPFTAGQLTPLFTFSSTDNCTEGGVLELIGTDGIAAPILAGNNVGSQLSTSGGGVDQPVCVDATAISIVCPNNGGNTGGNTGNTSDCDVTYVLTESNGSYQVSIESNVTYTGINNTIASMQVSLRVPTGTFEVDNSCVSDTYANTDFFVSTVSSPSETPTFDYINFTIDGSTSSEIPFTAGQTTPLFTFKSTSNCTSGGLLELIGMGGIATPTLAGNNVGSQLSTAGGGIDQPICVDATTVPIVCSSDNNTPPSNCDVTYLLTETNGVYQVSMESNVTYTGINNTIASMQVSLRAPAGVVTVDESCILDTHGNTEYIVSRVPSPPETPNYDYFNFTIDGSTSSDISFVAGQTLPCSLSTFYFRRRHRSTYLCRCSSSTYCLFLRY